MADARRIIHHARIEAQRERVAYNNPISVEELTKQVCDLKQMYTQYGGTRPFGTALLILGADNSGVKLFETDPSGAFSGVYAAAIGSGRKDVEAMFEKSYNEKAGLEDSIRLAYKALKSVGGKGTSIDTLEFYYVMAEEAKFKKLPVDELRKILKLKG